MKGYLKIVMLFLAIACMFALAACNGTDEKKETNPTLENNKNEQSNSSEEQKNPEAKPSNEKTTKPSPEPDSKNRTLNQKSINHVKDLFELAKEGKVPNVPFGAHTGDIEEIEKALGKPSSVKGNGEDKIYVYKVNNQYELKFVIPKSTGKVDHISVFSPEDSINKMAG
ncbi:YjgB family protein [Bacillus cereus]